VARSAGPVLPRFRNKLFFFAGYQGHDSEIESQFKHRLCSDGGRAPGNFTTAAGPLCNGGTQKTLAASLGFANNTIAPSLLNPAALKITSYLPTSSDPCGLVQYGLLNNQSEHMGVARIDYTQNDKSTIFGRAYVTNLNIPSTFQAGNALTLNSNAQLDRVLRWPSETPICSAATWSTPSIWGEPDHHPKNHRRLCYLAGNWA